MEVELNFLITALTLGAGATIVAASKLRHLNKFKQIGLHIKKLAKGLKKKASFKRQTGQTGGQVDLGLSKPDNQVADVSGSDPETPNDKRAKSSPESLRVLEPGNQAELFNSFDSNEKVPAVYREDSRFESLASDPAHGNKISTGSRREAMAGLEAESQGFLKPEISRGPAEIEFLDADGVPYDVKTPPSARSGQKNFFNAKKTGKSILRQVDKEFAHSKTGELENVKVILDSTYLNPDDHKALWEYLSENATQEQLARIIEVNVKL